MSENTGNRENQGKPNDRGSDESARPGREPGRDGFRNQQRRNGVGSQERTGRPSAGNRTVSGQDAGEARSVPNPNSRDYSRRDSGSDGRRKGGQRPGQPMAQDGNTQNRTAPAGGNKHITREIRPEDAQSNPTVGNRDHRNKGNNPNFDKRGNRNEIRPERRSEPKNWSRNIRAEETSEDIRKDNERIEKDIWLEIAGIHTMKLD